MEEIVFCPDPSSADHLIHKRGSKSKLIYSNNSISNISICRDKKTGLDLFNFWISWSGGNSSLELMVLQVCILMLKKINGWKRISNT